MFTAITSISVTGCMQAALESVRPRISRDLFTVYEKFQSENRSKTV